MGHAGEIVWDSVRNGRLVKKGVKRFIYGFEFEHEISKVVSWKCDVIF